MININDLNGTVTMSLKDYETMRDREDLFHKEKEKFEQGLFKIEEYKSYYGSGTQKYTSWLTKDEVYDELKGKIKAQKQITEDLKEKYKNMTLFKILRLR